MPILFIGVACINLSIGIYVLSRNKNKMPNRAFFLFSFGAWMWVGGFGVLSITHETFLIPFINLGCTLLLLGLFWLANVFPESCIKKQKSIGRYAPFIAGAIVSVYPGFLIKSVTFVKYQVLPTQGPLFLPYTLWFSAYTLATIALLYRNYHCAEPPEKKRLQYFFFGTVCFVFAIMLFDIVLPAAGIFAANFIGPLASVISFTATAYAIIRHKLMDIRIVILRSLMYSLLLCLVFLLYIALVTGLTYALDDSEDFEALIAAGTTMATGILGTPFITKYFRKITDPIFFKNTYRYAEAIEQLTAVLNSNLQVDILITSSLHELSRILRPEYAVFSHTKSGLWYGIKGVQAALEDELLIHPRIFQMPICSGKRQLGNFVFGPKRSGDSYTAEDKTLIRTFAGQATVAFEKAELYQKLKDRNSRLEEKVKDRTKHLQEIQEEQREFFDDVSHALQTPLTVLKSGIELIKKHEKSTDISLYNSMETSIDDLSRLVSNMLRLARIQNDTRSNVVTGFDVSLCIARITEYVAIIAESHDIRVMTDIEPGIHIDGDSSQIDELVTNILSNAVKYTAHCDERSIHVQLSQSEDSVVFAVKDSGVGIPPDQLPHIFKRFYRADSGDHPLEGSGLGLAIVQRIVQRHNGIIHVQSSLGIGTTFTITLPLSRQD